MADVAAPDRVMPSQHQATPGSPAVHGNERDHLHDFRDASDCSTDT